MLVLLASRSTAGGTSKVSFVPIMLFVNGMCGWKASCMVQEVPQDGGQVRDLGRGEGDCGEHHNKVDEAGFHR